MIGDSTADHAILSKRKRVLLNLNLQMSTTVPSTGPPNSAGERQPLLGSRPGSVHASPHPDPETASAADEPKDAAKKVDHWRVTWYLVLATFGGILFVVMIKSFVENGDIKVRAMMVSVVSRLANYYCLHDP